MRRGLQEDEVAPRTAPSYRIVVASEEGAVLILIVDDNALVRRGLVTSLLRLRSRGLPVEPAEACSRVTALDALRATRPDCVITELSLTGDPNDRSGLCLVFEILGGFVDPPLVIVHTGQNVSRPERARLFAHDVHVFIKSNEPEDGVVLVEAVHDRLIRRRALARCGPAESGIRLVEKPAAIGRVRASLAQQAKLRIDAALAKTNGNVTRAAMLLGESRRWVQRNRRKPGGGE